MKRVSKHHHLQVFVLKLNKYESFQPLEVVGRGSETQLQVDENLNKSNLACKVLTLVMLNCFFIFFYSFDANYGFKWRKVFIFMKK